MTTALLRRTALIGGTATVLLVSGCGSAPSYGSGLAQFSASATPTPSPTPATSADTPAPTAAAAATPAPTHRVVTTSAPAATPRPTTAPAKTPPPAVGIVGIYADDHGRQFDPNLIIVSRGAIVKWVNDDTVARSVVADGGQFSSPSIPPGGSWSWTATGSGQINYHDGTRPYAVGTVQIS